MQRRMTASELQITLTLTLRQVVQNEGNLYKTPTGSNDDWYWLYGTVSARHDGILISNDQMRDHIFELLRPKYFLKWRAHHQFTYRGFGDLDEEPAAAAAAAVEVANDTAAAAELAQADTGEAAQDGARPLQEAARQGKDDSRLDIVPPPVFTTCVQQVPETGAWMLPMAGGRWLCARPRLVGANAP